MTEEEAPTAAPPPGQSKKLPDWERIEADYRAGLLSLREIGAKNGSVTEGAIRKRAKKLGWTRDLAAKIQAKADDLVRKEAVRIPGTQQTEYAPAAERVLVEANAQAIATVRLSHRKDIATARTLCVTLLAELNTVTGEQLTIELLADLRDQLEFAEPSEATTKALAKARDALYKAMSLPSRAGSLKALADSLKTLVGLEREAWGLKVDDAGGSDAPPPIIPISFASGGPGYGGTTLNTDEDENDAANSDGTTQPEA